MYLGEKNQFISSFWLQRQWILETEVESENLIYSIRPYKKRWYENDTQINSSDQLSKSIRLVIDEVCPEQWTKTIFINDFINYALSVTQIHHLEIHTKIFTGKLMEILRLLPEVKTLKIYSLPLSESGYLSNVEIEFLCSLLTQNQITKIYLENLTEIDELYMLTLICSRVNHLQIECINYLHAEMLVQLILTQIIDASEYRLRLLSVRIPEAHGGMIEKLEVMIGNENLGCNYTIKHVMDKIYLELK